MLDFVDLRLKILLHGYQFMPDWATTMWPTPFWRLYWNATPGVSIEFGRETFELEPSSIILVAPDTEFTTRLRNPTRHFHVHFTIDEAAARMEPRIFSLPVNEQRRRLIDRIITIAPAGGLKSFSGTLAVHELIFSVFEEVPPEAWLERALDPRVQQAIVKINETLEWGRDPSSINDRSLADAGSMSTSAFVRLFSREMGISPMRYFMERRLYRAAIQLHHTSRSIEAIADECGFCDRNHFSRSFSKRYGIGPAEYRRNTALRPR